MTDGLRLYATGLFEGEGSFSLCSPSGTDKYHRARATLAMTDEDIVRRFHAIVGVGKVFGPHNDRRPNAKPVWQWRAARFEDVQYVVALLWGDLGPRRQEQARHALVGDESRG